MRPAPSFGETPPYAPGKRRGLPPLAIALASLIAGCSYGTTQPATDITDSGATLNGHVTAGSSSESSYWFEYGTDPAYPNRPTPGHSRTPTRTLQIGDGRRSVAEPITGLAPDTTYHFRLCARDSEGQSDAGCNDPQQFRTEPVPEPSALEIDAQPALYPNFDPAASDYVTRCTGDPVAVDVAAPPGTDVAVDGGSAASGRFSEPVALAEGQRFEIQTTTAGTTQTYHVRCLPAAFPNWTYSRTGGLTENWTLTSILVDPFAPSLSDSRYVTFFDGAGVPVWWYRPDGVPPIDASVVAGNVAFSEWNGRAFNDNPALKYQVRQLDGSLVRTLETVDMPTDFHDLQPLANGTTSSSAIGRATAWI